MARDNVPVQSAPGANNGAQLTWTALDATNDMEVPNDGHTIVLIRNGSGFTLNASVLAVDCSHGRAVDEAAAIPNGEDYKFGPYPPEEWNGEETAGKLSIDVDQDTSSYICAISF